LYICLLKNYSNYKYFGKMKRKIDKYLDVWAVNPQRKPLVIRGARQIGKTYSVRQLAKRKFKHYIEVNFERHSDLAGIFDSKNPELIMAELSAYFSLPVVPGETLLFLDEIQMTPKALATLRYFYEEMPDLHVVAAGSLLDHTLNEMHYSMPVGRVEYAYMYPLNFMEFITALDENGLADYIAKFRINQNFSAVLHKKLLTLLRLYYFIGGMPEAIRVYLETNDLSQVEKIHENILTSLQYDFAKYAHLKQQQLLRQVLWYVATNPGKEIVYSKVVQGERIEQIKLALYKLQMSRLVHLVQMTRSADVPLTSLTSKEKYKPVFIDIGLANHLSGIRLKDIKDLILMNEGAMAEQFTGQEFIASLNPPYMDTKLFFWKRDAKNSNAEVDYLLQKANQIYPVEIKAGKTGTLKSLQIFLQMYNKKTGIRFNTDLPSLGKDLEALVRIKNEMKKLHYDLLSLPLYLAGKINAVLDDL